MSDEDDHDNDDIDDVEDTEHNQDDGTTNADDNRRLSTAME